MANAMILNLTREIIFKMVNSANEECAKGNFKSMEPLHHFTAGIKAMATSYAYDGIDELR